MGEGGRAPDDVISVFFNSNYIYSVDRGLTESLCGVVNLILKHILLNGFLALFSQECC